MPFLKDKKKLVSNSLKLDNLTRKNGLRHSVYTVPGDKYNGEWRNNEKNGHGSLLTRHHDKLYEGQWWCNYRHGFGTFALARENKLYSLQYRGDWKKGKPCGWGEWHYPDHAYYKGGWKNGLRHGYGQMWYADGAYYDGFWWKDMHHGKGMLVRSDGNRYEGEFQLDMKHGKGRFFHLDTGQLQEGVWYKDVCIYSCIVDIPYRQSAVKPTIYPIPSVELQYPDEVCEKRETQALEEQLNSCTSISLTKSSSQCCESRVSKKSSRTVTTLQI